MAVLELHLLAAQPTPWWCVGLVHVRSRDHMDEVKAMHSMGCTNQMTAPLMTSYGARMKRLCIKGNIIGFPRRYDVKYAAIEGLSINPA